MALISVVIPTHNRACYAIRTIRSVLEASPCIEVVVSDTSELDEISCEFKSDEDANRIKFIRPGSSMSVVENFNAGLQAATGDYLVFIGDDDFVTSDIEAVASWALSQSVDSVKFSFPAQYYWSDFKRSRGGDISSSLQLTSFTGRICRHNSLEALYEALEYVGNGPMNMPRAYLGMVSRDLIHRIVERYGGLFGGVSPDIYSAALVSMEAMKCVVVDYPIIVPGASSASTTGQSAEGKHVGKLNANSHTGAFKDLSWDIRIPEFYSVPTVWAYSLLKAVEKNPVLESKMNYSRLFVKCFFYHFSYKREIIKSLKQYYSSCKLSKFLYNIGKAIIKEFLWLFGKFRGMLLLVRGKKDTNSIENLNDVIEAREALSCYLKKKRFSIKFCNE